MKKVIFSILFFAIGFSCFSEQKCNKIPEEYEKTKAALRLMCELEKGRKAGEEQGWLSSDDVREHFRRKTNG